MKCKTWPIGVCTWSLQRDIAGVADAVRDLGLGHVHLAVGPALEKGGNQYLDAVAAQDWMITSTMIDFPQEDYSTLDTIKVTGGIVPDTHWAQNRDRFMRAADVTAQLGVKYLSMHAGFIDESDKAQAEKMGKRIGTLADAAHDRGVMLLLETGQETAAELQQFLKKLDHNSVGVNFDPANMILYGKGNPIEAVRVLAPWIRHLHIKDAVAAPERGTWGAEVPWGAGEVGAAPLLNVLDEVGFEGAMAIEREGGDDRLGDIKRAIEWLTSAG